MCVSCNEYILYRVSQYVLESDYVSQLDAHYSNSYEHMILVEVTNGLVKQLGLLSLIHGILQLLLKIARTLVPRKVEGHSDYQNKVMDKKIHRKNSYFFNIKYGLMKRFLHPLSSTSI